MGLALAAEPALENGAPHVNLIVIDGSINPATADYISESLTTSERDGARALIIQLDTPGGLLETTKIIVKDLLAAPLPVIVYVAPSGGGATSAGVFITIAANIAAMAPGTTIGAAHPVGSSGETIEGDMREKVENFAASLSKSIAEQRGRNVEWAEKAVRESVSATEKEALELKIVDLIASDVDDLLRQLDGREVTVSGGSTKIEVAGATVNTLPMSLKQQVLNVVAHPNVAYLLMMAGLLGLYVEFTNPGIFFPGVAGGICLLLGLIAMQVLPINYGGLALIGLGVALLVAELFLPTFGVVGVGGIVAFILGSLLLFDTPDSTIAVDPAIIFAAAGTLGAFSLIVGTLVVRSQRMQSPLGSEGLIGQRGEVRSPVGPGQRGGKVFLHGEYWNADADEVIEVGATVSVVGVDGLRVKVQKVP